MKMSFLNIHEAAILITIVEIVFLCLALRFLSNKRVQPRNLLIAFFVAVAGTLLSTLIIWNPHFQSMAIARYSIVPAVLSFCFLMEGPLLYGYLRSLSEELNLKSPRAAVHLVVPVCVAVAILLMNIRVVDWVPWNWPALSSAKYLVLQVTWALFKCWPAVYVAACFRTEYRLRKRMPQMYSNISAWELRWADIILVGFFVHWFWGFSGYLLSNVLSREVHDYLGIINNYFTVLLVNGLFVYALVNGRNLLDLPSDEPESTDVKPLADVEGKVAKIEAAIKDKAVYLNSQINLDRFAEHCGLKPREVSVVLNRHYGKNFFEFINELRVNEVKEQLIAYPDKTILEIATEAGFNSQSAFQRFFKRIVGMTPSQYRRSFTALPESSA